MHHPARLVIAVACASFCLPAFAGPCSSLESLSWLLGDWVAQGEKSTTRESWSALSAQTWEGKGVQTSRAGSANANTEDLRLLEMKDGVFYVAKVDHNELPVAFRLTECEGNRFAFENPAHDFPRRLDYTRQGDDRLVVRVSDGADQGFTLDFARVPAAAAGPAAVLAAEDARFAAMVDAKPEALGRWLAEGLTYVHSTGRLQNREQLIGDLVSGRLRYLAIEPSERQVSFQGPDIAVVQGLARIQARAGEQTVDFPARYLAVYQRSDSTWRLTAWQSLRLHGAVAE